MARLLGLLALVLLLDQCQTDEKGERKTPPPPSFISFYTRVWVYKRGKGFFTPVSLSLSD